jgi:hypothetical protein
MPSVTVQITRFVDDSFPGFVECELVDANGTKHLFVDKVSVLSLFHLCSSSSYPCTGSIRCTLGAEYKDESGHAVVNISTEIPDHVETKEGNTRFVVLSSQLSRF